MSSSHLVSGFEKKAMAFDTSIMQSKASWHHLNLSREIANQLIDDQGQINEKVLFCLLDELPQEKYSLSPGKEVEALGMSHIMRCLQTIQSDQTWRAALKRIKKPTANAGADHLIRRSQLLKEGTPITDAAARRAALSALLTPLRQNVGSCFATAPAILIQSMQPLQFLADIAQLFGIGALKRTFGGVEYLVPLAVTPGHGSLLQPIFWHELGENPLKSLGSAPSLIAAFKAAGLMKGNGKSATSLLKRTLSKVENPFHVVTADELIQTVLKEAFNVTDKQIQTYKQREVSQPISMPVVMVPTGKTGGAVQSYLRAYKAASEAFVSQTEHPLLKAWEFTLASFAEVKADISKWNLYISLGFEPNQVDGIGEALQKAIQDKLTVINDELAECQSRYDHTFAQVKSLEGRMKSSSSEQDLKWLQAEYRQQRGEIDKVLARQDAIHEKGQRIGSVMKFLVEFYLLKFIDYFQEVYDPELRELSQDIYDDAPAGFRLLYKYGRANPSVWTWIENANDFLKALASFFTATEVEMSGYKEFKGIERDLSDLVTSVILATKSSSFLEASLKRLAYAYKEPLMPNPLEHLDKVQRKPWAYRSGGTMGTLVSAYFAKTTPPTEVKRWVESEMELLVFYLDAIKDLPLSTQKSFLENPEQSGLLAYSPTHAFIVRPGWEPFAQGWQTSAYTYSWVRDHWVVPCEAFWDTIWLEKEHKCLLIKQLCQKFPSGYRPIVRGALKNLPTNRMRVGDFRERVLEILSYEKWVGASLSVLEETFDQLLYETLPFVENDAVQDLLERIFDTMVEVSADLKTQLMQACRAEKPIKENIVSASVLQQLASSLLIKVLGQTRTHIFYTKSIVNAMRKLKLYPPSPVIFADPNWPDQTFGFVVNPGTSKLQLWLLDALGTHGRPMSRWQHYLDGRDKKDWGIYIKPSEYS